MVFLYKYIFVWMTYHSGRSRENGKPKHGELRSNDHLIPKESSEKEPVWLIKGSFLYTNDCKPL